MATAEPPVTVPESTWKEPPPPGIHPGVPFDVYASWDATNHSLLREVGRSPAHAREYLVHPPASTKDQDFGHALHVAVLEPDRFDAQYVLAIKVDRRTNVGKAAWAEFCTANAHRIPLIPDEYEQCMAMREAVWTSSAAELLKGPGLNEVCAVWKDDETGLTCKARYDRLTARLGWSVIVDVKTAVDGGMDVFARACARYAYHEQCAFYLDGAAALAPRERRFLHLVVEKDRPHCVVVYELDDQAIEAGRRRNRRALRALAKAKQTGIWPGYPDGWNPLSIPKWAVKEEPLPEGIEEQEEAS